MTEAPRRAKLQLTMTKDGRLLRLNFQPSGPDTVSITLPMEAAEVDALIDSLAKGRMKMAEPVTFGPSDTITATPNPQIHQYTDPASGDPVLMIRHPGLGWLNFALTKDRAAQLAESLLQLVHSARN